MNIKRQHACLIIVLVLFTVVLSACDDGANKSNFKSLISSAAQKASGPASILNITVALPDVRVGKNTMMLNTDQPSYSYAILQDLAEAGMLDKGQHQGQMIVYSIKDKDTIKNIIFQDRNGLQIQIGSLTPDKITNFTKPDDHESNPDSTATVEFKTTYEDWLSKKQLQTLRDWYALTYQMRYQGDNPAMKSPRQILHKPVLVMTGIYSRQQANLFKQWVPLGLTGAKINILMHKSDGGWQVANTPSHWSLTDIRGIEPMTGNDLRKAQKTIKARLNPDVSEPGKIHESTVVEALKHSLAANKQMAVQSPFAKTSVGEKLAPIHCNVKARRGWNKIDMRYDCSEDEAAQLNALVEEDLARRTVVSAGHVTYSPTEKLRSHIHHGHLALGTLNVKAIISQKPDITWDGKARVKAEIKAQPKLEKWAKNPAFDTQDIDTDKPGTYRVTMTRTGDGHWQATQVTAEKAQGTRLSKSSKSFNRSKREEQKTTGKQTESLQFSDGEAAHMISRYYEHMDIAKRGGRSISWRAKGLDSDNGVTCRDGIHGVKPAKRRKIEHSAAYQRVGTRCYSIGKRQMKAATEMGLVKKTSSSPFIYNYVLTDAGHKHIISRKNNRHEILVAPTSLENILKTKGQVNRYGVSTVDITFTTIPKVADWARPYTGKGKAISFGNFRSTRHVAQFWKTSKGWQPLYVFKK